MVSGCRGLWLVSNGIIKFSAFMELWVEFLRKSSERLKSVANRDVEIILYTSELTGEEYLDNLRKEEVTVQIWTNGSDIKDKQVR